MINGEQSVPDLVFSGTESLQDSSPVYLSVPLTTETGTVLSFSPEMSRRGPRWGLWMSTLSSVQGLKLANAPWKSGLPGAGTASSLIKAVCFGVIDTPFAKANWNCSKLTGTARPTLRGLVSTGEAALSSESGSASMPRKAAGGDGGRRRLPPLYRPAARQ